MTRSLAAVLLLASGWSWTGLGLDRVRWNERERSEAGIESLEAGREQEALDAFETAARLDAENPLLRFNAGSAHLATGSENAVPHLEAAAEMASGGLAPPANYNLGNARLAAGDTAGAIEAYEQALRLTPDYEDAKFNLELALRQQQQEQQQQEQQQQGGESPQQNDENGNQEQQTGEDGEQQDERPPDSGDQQEQKQQPNPENGEPEAEGEGQSNQDLPRFEEQPDMSAEQAAAILEAVENLEREQRRLQAAEEMKKRSRKGKDW